MSQHRFAVTGAQGVGKTTLARDLYERCCSHLQGCCILLAGIGDRVRGRGYPLGSLATPETIYVFAAEHLRREREHQAAIVIQDRCLLDLLAYARVLGNLSKASLEMLEQLVLSSCTQMDAIFYVPICEETNEAKEAREDSQLRTAVALEIEVAACDLGLALYRITGTPEERLEAAFTFIRQAVN